MQAKTNTLRPFAMTTSDHRENCPTDECVKAIFRRYNAAQIEIDGLLLQLRAVNGRRRDWIRKLSIRQSISPTRRASIPNRRAVLLSIWLMSVKPERPKLSDRSRNLWRNVRK